MIGHIMDDTTERSANGTTYGEAKLKESSPNF